MEYKFFASVVFSFIYKRNMLLLLLLLHKKQLSSISLLCFHSYLLIEAKATVLFLKIFCFCFFVFQSKTFPFFSKRKLFVSFHPHYIHANCHRYTYVPVKKELYSTSNRFFHFHKYILYLIAYIRLGIATHTYWLMEWNQCFMV